MYCSSSAYNRCLSLRRRHKMAYKNSPVFFFFWTFLYIFPLFFWTSFVFKTKLYFFLKQIDILRIQTKLFCFNIIFIIICFNIRITIAFIYIIFNFVSTSIYFIVCAFSGYRAKWSQQKITWPIVKVLC